MKHLAAVVVLALAPAAFGELVTNGDFETPTVAGPVAPLYETISAGATTLTGWTIGGTDIELIGTFWTAAVGSQSLDLSGNNAGSISQTLTTAVGQTYQLSYYFAGTPGTVGNMNVALSGGATYSQNVSFNALGTSTGSMGWIQNVVQFTATSTSTVLTFTSLNNNATGPALDLVSVTEVPEPATYALFALGIGGLGLWRRSQRKRTAAKA